MKIQGTNEAICCFDKVLEIDPKNVNSLVMRCASIEELKRYDEAIIYYDKVLEIDPKNADALNKKGCSLYEIGKYDWFLLSKTRRYYYHLLSFINSSRQQDFRRLSFVDKYDKG